MNGRRLLAIAFLGIAAAGSAFAGWCAGGSPAGSRIQSIKSGTFAGHNLLLVTIDTLRADRLGSYGSTAGLSPTLDRFASEGIRFETVFAHAVTTLASHTSIMSGKYPSTHGVHDNGTFHVKPSEATLATILQQAGYDTAAFVAAFVLDARFGLNRGFDHYDDRYEDSQAAERGALSAFEVVERRADAVIDPAERWIAAHSTRPWFVWVHLYDPHAPYDAPAAIQAAHRDDPYGAEVAYADGALGRFLERLRGTGQLDRTLLVITSDHGEALGDHHEKTHGTFAYNSVLKVPWLMWAATSLRPQAFSGAVRHVDLMPTVLDFLGVPLPGAIDGQSLRPFLTRERSYEPPASYFEALNTHLTRNWAPLRGVVWRGYKLVDLPIPEVYDLERDPEERHNVYAGSSAMVRLLASELSSLMSEAEPIRPASPDRESVERLRALGYLSAPAGGGRKTRFTEADDPKKLIAVANQYEEAAESFARGQLERAAALLHVLSEREKNSAQAHQELAYVLHQSGRATEAIAVLDKAVRNGLADPSLLAQLGIYLLRAGELERSTSLLSDAIRKEPFHVEAHNYLGIAYTRLGRRAEARSELETVLGLEPNSATALANLGTIELETGKFADALVRFKAALAVDPRFAAAYNGLGVAYAQLGDVERSVDCWQTAVRLDPGQFDALYNVGATLFRRNPQDAVPYLERFVRTAPAESYADDIVKARRLLRKTAETSHSNQNRQR